MRRRYCKKMPQNVPGKERCCTTLYHAPPAAFLQAYAAVLVHVPTTPPGNVSFTILDRGDRPVYEYSSTSSEKNLRCAVNAAFATTQARLQAQHQDARGLHVVRAASGIGQCRRPRHRRRRLGILLLHASTASAKQGQSLRLDPCVSRRGGNVAMLPTADRKGPPNKFGPPHGRASVCTLLPCVPGLVPCNSTLRASSKGSG